MIYGVRKQKEEEVEQPWIAQVQQVIGEGDTADIKVAYLNKLYGRRYARCETLKVHSVNVVVGPIKVHKSV